MNQDRQKITLLGIIPSYIGIKGYADWVESFCIMEKKDGDDYMSTAVHKGDYGTVDTAGVFH